MCKHHRLRDGRNLWFQRFVAEHDTSYFLKQYPLTSLKKGQLDSLDFDNGLVYRTNLNNIGEQSQKLYIKYREYGSV